LFRKDEVSLDEPHAGRQKHTREMVIAALDTGMRRGEVLNQLWEDVDATFIQMFWIFGQPAAVLAVGARHALSSVMLRPSFIHSDSVVQITFLGCGHAAIFDFVLDQSQYLSLKIRLTYCVLDNEPRGKRAVRTDEVGIRPSLFGDDLA
jgi:hypothetical protein